VRNLVRDAILDLLAALITMTVLVFVIIAVAVIGGFWELANLEPSLLSITGLVLMLGSVQAPLLFFGWRRLRRNRQKGRAAVPLFEGDAPRGILRGMAAGLLLSATSALYSALIQRTLGTDAVPQQLEFLKQLLNDRAALAVLALIIAGLAPVCEELFFRAAIFGSARAAGHTVPGAAISAILFATVHFSVVLAPFYMFFALVMCWLLVRSRTLAAPIAAHMTMNGLACLAIVFSGGTAI
jgi:membrane protease YdiL (CAAX protease family)